MNRASYQRAFLYRDLDMNTFGRVGERKKGVMDRLTIRRR